VNSEKKIVKIFQFTKLQKIVKIFQFTKLPMLRKKDLK